MFEMFLSCCQYDIYVSTLNLPNLFCLLITLKNISVFNTMFNKPSNLLSPLPYHKWTLVKELADHLMPQCTVAMVP